MADPDLPALLDDPAGYLDDPDPAVRRLAVSLCATAPDTPGIGDRLLVVLDADGDGAVRAAAAEAVVEVDAARVPEALLSATGDVDVRVVEAAVTALGELPPTGPIVARLVELATDPSADTRVREAAVASLGAVGDATAVPVLLELLAGGPPQVRRRAVVALTVFDDPAVEPALRAATDDRNPMVREVAEMVVGRDGRGG